MLWQGQHPIECQASELLTLGGGLRWTEGDAALPAALFEAFEGPAELVLYLAGTTHFALFEAAQRVAV